MKTLLFKYFFDQHLCGVSICSRASFPEPERVWPSLSDADYRVALIPERLAENIEFQCEADWVTARLIWFDFKRAEGLRIHSSGFNWGGRGGEGVISDTITSIASVHPGEGSSSVSLLKGSSFFFPR